MWRAISALSRNSVTKYRTWDQLEGFLGGGELPAAEVIEKRLVTLVLKQMFFSGRGGKRKNYPKIPGPNQTEDQDPSRSREVDQSSRIWIAQLG